MTDPASGLLVDPRYLGHLYPVHEVIVTIGDTITPLVDCSGPRLVLVFQFGAGGHQDPCVLTMNQHYAWTGNGPITTQRIVMDFDKFRGLMSQCWFAICAPGKHNDCQIFSSFFQGET